MNYRSQLICAWLGIVAASLGLPAIWLLMRFLPPLDPMLPAAEVAAIYRGNGTGIIAGAVLLQLTATLNMPFFAVYSIYISRMEAPSRLWTYTMLLTTAIGFATVLILQIFFSIAAYRPERPDAIIHMLSDLAFMTLIAPAIPATGQMFAAGFSILNDRSPSPLLPRWLGFFSLWGGILALPGATVALMKIGPFTWSGVLGFWIPVIAFGLWTIASAWELQKAVRRDMRASLA